MVGEEWERGKQANEASFWSHQGFDILQLASISTASVWVPEGEKKSKARLISRGAEPSAGSLCSAVFGCSSRRTRHSEQGPEILLPSPPAGSRAYLQIYSSCQQEVRVYKFPGKKASIPVLHHSLVGMLPRGGVLGWVWETGMSFGHVKHTDK